MERVFRQKPSPPAPLPVRGRGEPTGNRVAGIWRHAASSVRVRGGMAPLQSPSPAHRERGWGEGRPSRRHAVLKATPPAGCRGRRPGAHEEFHYLRSHFAVR
jgi:hypothetical protein